MDEALEVRVKSCDDVTLVEVAGELDIATIAKLHEKMVGARRTRTSTVVIDTGELEFVGAGGFRALAAETAALRRGSRHVCMVNMRPNVQRAANILQLESLLGVR